MKWRLTLGALLVLASAYSARTVAFSTEPTAHFPRESASVRAWLDLSSRFDAFNTLIVGLEEPVAPLLGLERVKEITDRLTALKSNGVLAVASVTNVESIHEGADGSLETELLVEKLPHDKASLEALSRKIAADAQVSGALISRDQRGYVIVLRADPRRDAAELAEAIRAVVEAQRGALSATYFGAAFFQAVPGRAIAAHLGWLIPAVLLVIFGVLALMIRSARTIAIVLGAAVMTLGVWLAALRLGAVVLTLTSMTAALVVFVLAALAFARILESGLREVVPALVAIGLGCTSLLLIPALAPLGASLGYGSLAILLVGALLVEPFGPGAKKAAALLIARIAAALPTAPSAAAPMFAPARWVGEAKQAPPAAPAVSAMSMLFVALGLSGFGLIATRAHFKGTPQTLFSEGDEVGESLSFFDRRFGGPDFVQVDFRGDLRDPEIAARLLRLTDLLEGPQAFGDVRAVAPILGFLNHGFGGIHRIPTSGEALNNLWFFLEGRPDVRNLVSEPRDEAMIVLRVPSKLHSPIERLAAIVDEAITASVEQGRGSAKRRLTALASVYALPLDRLDAALDAPAPATKDAVNASLRTWLASGDSPYQPAPAEWAQLEAALDDAPKLTAVAASFAGLSRDPQLAAQLVDSVLARQKDLRLTLRALSMADALWDGAPPAARIRAQGIFADLLEPQAGPGTHATIIVTGLPIVAATIDRDSMRGLWCALGLLLAIAAAVLLILTRGPGTTARAVVEAALAAVMTLAIAGTLGLGVDPGSLAIFVLPPLAALLVSASARWSIGFCLALGAAGTPLLFVGVLPLARVGAALAIGLTLVALIHSVSRRTFSGPPAAP